MSWNPGPRRGKEGAIEEHIAGKWHIIALQEAIEYLDHDYLTSHYYVTRFAGCAVLFNKDTLHSDIKVTSVYIHDNGDQPQQSVKEGQSGLVLQAVISRAPFRRLPRNGKSFFAVMSLHIINNYEGNAVLERN